MLLLKLLLKMLTKFHEFFPLFLRNGKTPSSVQKYLEHYLLY